MKNLTATERQQAAQQLGLHEQYVYQVLTRRKTLPLERCAAFEVATGIPCEELRPDIKWHRVADAAWSAHPAGRPLIDIAVGPTPQTALQDAV